VKPIRHIWRLCLHSLVVTLMLALAGCQADVPAPVRPVKADVGYSAPDFELENLAGEKVKLSDYRGQVVVLNFWATWCAPCRIELPVLKGLPKKYDDDSLVVLAIDQGEPKEEVAAFAQKNGFPFTVLLDTDLSLGKAYKARTIPTTYVVDADGVIQYKRRGVLIPGELDLAIRPLIAANELSQ